MEIWGCEVGVVGQIWGERLRQESATVSRGQLGPSTQHQHHLLCYELNFPPNNSYNASVHCFGAAFDPDSDPG